MAAKTFFREAGFFQVWRNSLVFGPDGRYIFFNMGSYDLTPFIWPPFFAGLMIGALGVWMALRERFSALSLSFLLLTSCVAGWLLSYAVVYSAQDGPSALLWIKIANTFVAFIPSVFFFFVLTAARLTGRRAFQVFATAFLSQIFVILIWGTNFFVRGEEKFFWGYYAGYGPATFLYLAFFFVLMASSFRLLWKCHIKYGANTQRFKTFLIGCGIASLASVDFFAAYGIALYPCGYLPIFVFTLFMARGILKRHLADITPSFAAEQILKTMADPLMVIDREGRVRLANEAAQLLFSENGKDLMGQIFAPESVDFFKKQNLARLLWTGGVQSHEVVYFSKLYGMHTLDISTSVIRDSHKDPLAVVCIIKNVTSKKSAELALRESEKHYRLLAEHVTDVIWTMDTNLKLTYVSPSIVRLRGYSPAEAVGQDLEKTFAGISAKNALVSFTGLLQGGEPYAVMELEYTCKNGSTVWAEVTLSLIRNEKGMPQEILGVSRNITEHRKVREALKVSEGIYQELAAAVSDPIFILDRNGMLKYVNQAMEQALGTAASSLAGKPLAKSGLLAPESEAKVLQEVTCIFLGWQRHYFDVRFVRKDGGRVVMEAHAKLMRKDSDQPFVQIIFKNVRQVAGFSQDQNVA